jgi:hypothetical protein
MKMYLIFSGRVAEPGVGLLNNSLVHMLALLSVVYKETHVVWKVAIDQDTLLLIVNVADSNSNTRGHCLDWRGVSRRVVNTKWKGYIESRQPQGLCVGKLRRDAR